MNNTTSTPSERHHRVHVPLLIILCVLLAVTTFGNISYAKYSSSTQGNSHAQVAVFAVDANAVTSGDLTINCAVGENTAAYTFIISNQKGGITAQVDIGYTIVVTLSEALPEGLTPALDGIAGIASSDGLTFTFSNADWLFDAGAASSRTHILSFTAQPDMLAEDVIISAIGVSILTEQIQ